MTKLSILSWNIAGAKASFSAPESWKEEYADETRKEIQSVIQKYKPDILILQEIPEPNWLPMLLSFVQYIPLGTAPTHSGYCALIVRRENASKIREVYQVGTSVLAFWEEQNGNLYAISSMHLCAGSKEGRNRIEQFKAVLETCREKRINGGVFAGDMNMRKKEDLDIESLHNPPLIDAWKELGTSKNRWTWDSRINHHNEHGFSFQARFDRIYYTKENITQHSFTRVGDRPLTNPRHFSSDHFGILAIMEFC